MACAIRLLYIQICVFVSDIHALCPALDLLRSAIQDTHTEAQSRQFCEQLLSITLTFLNTQTRVLLTGAHGNSFSMCSVHIDYTFRVCFKRFACSTELDVHLQECVHILDGYISDLRPYMKKFPWPDGSDAETPACPRTSTSDAVTEREWQSMSDEVSGTLFGYLHTFLGSNQMISN